MIYRSPALLPPRLLAGPPRFEPFDEALPFALCRDALPVTLVRLVRLDFSEERADSSKNLGAMNTLA